MYVVGLKLGKIYIKKEVDNLWLVNRPVFPVRRSEISTLVELVKYIEGMSHLLFD